MPHARFVEQAKRHDQIVAALAGVDPALQKMVAELVMMRLFDDFQDALSGIAARLTCGATYGDGSVPALLTAPATSIGAAMDLFTNHGRLKPRYPKWSKTKFINETTQNVMSASDHFLAACSAHSLVISEMQAVRNRIAHANTTSRAAYSIVVRRYYGANLNHISPGLFLMSPRFSPAKIEGYISASRLIIKACSRC